MKVRTQHLIDTCKCLLVFLMLGLMFISVPSNPGLPLATIGYLFLLIIICWLILRNCDQLIKKGDKA